MTLASRLTIYYIADDGVVAWLPAFLGSLRRHHPAARLIWIPFSERATVASSLARRAEAEVFDDQATLRSLDALGTAVMENDTVGARLFRKFAPHFSGGDPFLFLDVDTLVRQPLEHLFARLDQTGADLVYSDRDADAVFLPSAWRDSRIANMDGHLFNTGCVASRRLELDFAALQRLEASLPRPRSKIFAPTGEQPFYNLVASELDLRIAWAGHEFETLVRAKSRWRDLRQRPLLHWAGWPLSWTMPHAGRYASEAVRVCGTRSLRPLAEDMLLRHTYRLMRYDRYRRRLRGLRRPALSS